MKKIGIISMALLMLGIGTVNTGCMGSWGLTSGLYNWNKGATGNKFLDTGLFWILGIVYSITLMVDFFIFNLIEFWSGSNPVAMKEGDKEIQNVRANDGNEYQMTATRNRFEIVCLTGANKNQKTVLVYTPENATWNKETASGLVPVIAYNANLNKAEVYGTDGSAHLVDMGSVYAMANAK